MYKYTTNKKNPKNIYRRTHKKTTTNNFLKFFLYICILINLTKCKNGNIGIKKTKNIVYSNGFPAMPSMSIEEFKKLSLKEKAMFLDYHRPEGPEITIEEAVKWCKEARNEK